MKRYTFLPLLLSLLICLTGCGSDSPEREFPTRTVQIQGEDYALTLPESAVVRYLDGEVTVEISENTVETIDLTPLVEIPEFDRLTVTAGVPLGTLRLPSQPLDVTLELDTLDRLDASQTVHMKRLSVYGAVEEAELPDTLENLVCGGTSLSLFADCPALKRAAVFQTADLAHLADFPTLESLHLNRAEGDPLWDLSPLADVDFTTLRLGENVTPGELEGLAGASFPTLQISDEGIHDLSILKELPDTTCLLLSVSGDQPTEVQAIANSNDPCDAGTLAMLNTPIPLEQLTEFAGYGEIYLYTDLNR